MGRDQVGRSWFIEPKFEQLGPISRDGLTPAKIVGKAGYINRSGQFTIEQKFDEAGYFQEDGLARATIGKSQGLIDRTGNWVIEPKYELLVHGLQSYGGLIWFRAGKEWGAIDRSGQLVVKSQFHQPGAAVCDDGWGGGYIDRKQRAVRREDAPLPMPDGDLFGRNCDGPFQIQVGDKFGYVDRTLKPISEIRFESASEFFRDNALVKLDGKFGYIRPDGSWLIEPRFDEAYPLGDSAAVKFNGKFRCIKRDGTWLIEPQFASRFSPYDCAILVDAVAKTAGSASRLDDGETSPQA